MLKLKFDSNQEYQKQAIDSIVNIFQWQQVNNSKFTIVSQNVNTKIKSAQPSLDGMQTYTTWTSNKLELDEEDIYLNVNKIQNDNNLPLSATIVDDVYKIPNYTIEMETWTWKTYVYTRTILELYKNYWFSKFIIVVPSVAIREWVFKSLEITKSHFDSIYDGIQYHFFKYDSSNFSQTKDFAESQIIEIMIINIDAFRKTVENVDEESKANLIHKEHDKLSWIKPIDFIRQTNPIVIIDEPQSVDNTDKAKESILSLNPLFILRYSATHKVKYNLLYKLWPVESYEKKLVKRIEVLPVTWEWDNNVPYMKLIDVSNKNWYKAKLELDVLKNWVVTRKIVEVNSSNKSNLYLVSWERETYRWLILEWINCMPWEESIELTGWIMLKLWEAQWTVDDLEIKRAQIKATIYAHLDKEMKLLNQWIKVISLFFIDKVVNYREYNDDWSYSKWVYAKIFEQEYEKIIKEPKYNNLFNSDKFDSLLKVPVDSIHDWYFSADKNKRFKDSTEKWSKDDENTYKLIMKDKEKLLSFDCSLRFIFSHSALKEWWDNPNVFQICTLIETKDTITKRQKVWRWLRLCVDQQWNRIYDDNVNILTVIANESYELFAETLQKEMEDALNIKFGIIEEHIFSKIVYVENDNNIELGNDNSRKITQYLMNNWYINKKWKIENKLKKEIALKSFQLPDEYQMAQTQVVGIIKERIKSYPVFNYNDKVQIKLNKQVYLSDEFRSIWDKIKYKTYYNINFDENSFINSCLHDLRNMEEIPASKIVMKWVRLNIDNKWVSAQDPYKIKVSDMPNYEWNYPDILREIESSTWLKRQTIVKLLIDTNRFEDFYRNPQKFIEKVIWIINQNKKKVIVDGIKYHKLWDNYCYMQNEFDKKELISEFKSNVVEVENSIYSHIIYDSEVERAFAQRLNNNEDVRLFVKLPSWFLIDTPVGNYNPDWAIIFNKNWTEKLYFVIETKWSTNEEQRRLIENQKIQCAKKHFESLETWVMYKVVESFDDFLTNA